jgi:uncharacterized protein involved in exopolysaccharide biosynthesis
MSVIADVEETDVPDLRDYGRTVWRHRVLIGVTVALAVAAALGYSTSQKPQYKATAQLIIQRGSPLDSPSQDAQEAARNVDTETAVLRSKVVADAAAASLGHKPDVSVSTSATSDVVDVHAKASKDRKSVV